MNTATQATKTQDQRCASTSSLAMFCSVLRARIGNGQAEHDKRGEAGLADGLRHPWCCRRAWQAAAVCAADGHLPKPSRLQAGREYRSEGI